MLNPIVAFTPLVVIALIAFVQMFRGEATFMLWIIAGDLAVAIDAAYSLTT